MLMSILIGASLFVAVNMNGIVELIKEYRQFKYEESLDIEERMRIRGML